MKVAIIGSGIVGLTIAYTLSKENIDITIFEKERDSLSHGTGRNSGVIHSGIYYQPKTLRSTLCIRGSKLMKKFISENNLYINNCGKLLLPKTKKDIETLNLLYERSKEVGVETIKLNSFDEILKIEPNCNPLFNEALFIKETAIADPKEVSNKLIEILKKRGVIIKYDTKVDSISSDNTTIISNNKIHNFDLIINSAGLHADYLANKSNLKTRYTSLPFKGKYWKISFGDKNAYATSHVGWGLNNKSRYEALTMYDKSDLNGTELRALSGCFLYSIGANEFANRYTDGHFDLPMMDCTIYLDDEMVVNKGEVI